MSEIAVRTAAPPLWKMKDGRLIPIPDMTDSHLSNAIRMVIRNVESIRWQLGESLEYYLCGDPPDGAYFAASAALHELHNMTDFEVLYTGLPSFKHLVAEAKKRKLPVFRDVAQLYVEHVQSQPMTDEEYPLYDLNCDD